MRAVILLRKMTQFQILISRQPSYSREKEKELVIHVNVLFYPVKEKKWTVPLK